MLSSIETATRASAIQEIEYLQRWYARATDLLGTNQAELVAEGSAIYHRIFSPDVEITSTEKDAELRRANGISEWLDVVIGVLSPMGTTQHFIGTQLVEFQSLEIDDLGNVKSGAAVLTSHLQAWHDISPDQVYLFVGTYTSDVSFRTDAGWQIWRMNLERETIETRTKIC